MMSEFLQFIGVIACALVFVFVAFLAMVGVALDFCISPQELRLAAKLKKQGKL